MSVLADCGTGIASSNIGACAMKHMSLRKTSSAGLFLVGAIPAAGALAQAPQGAYSPGYGMTPGMMSGPCPGCRSDRGYGRGSGMNPCTLGG